MSAVLQVDNLHVSYPTARGLVRAVEGVTFALQPGERFGLVGESGSGKSTLGLAVLRLIRPPGRIEQGEIILDGKKLLALSAEQMRQVRLAEIAMVAQGAMNSLNPVMLVRQQLVDALIDHGQGLSERALEGRVRELLEWVGLRPQVADMYPHELSGGMKQRVVIAMAVSLRPKVIIADEPTSALDVVVQRQIMETLRRVQNDVGAAVILIGHDMGLMAQFVTRLGVMYAGKLVEVAPIRDVFREPLHPYTQALIASLPTLEEKEAFQGIAGMPPSLLNKPRGCPFHPRCPRVLDRCRADVPQLREVRPGRWVACHLY